jgi:hypothetical protein
MMRFAPAVGTHDPTTRFASHPALAGQGGLALEPPPIHNDPGVKAHG